MDPSKNDSNYVDYITSSTAVFAVDNLTQEYSPFDISSTKLPAKNQQLGFVYALHGLELIGESPYGGITL